VRQAERERELAEREAAGAAERAAAQDHALLERAAAADLEEALRRSVAEAASSAAEHEPPVESLAVVSLASASLDAGRPRAPESTFGGGETTCIICLTRPKTHIAVPCSHQCGPVRGAT